MELITGYKGQGHVTSRQYRDMMQSIVGSGSYIANLGEQLATELVSNNSIKIRSGMLLHHGGVFEVPSGTYDEITIANGTQGMKRIDLIVARYKKNSGTGVEGGEWSVIQGTPAESNPVTPTYTEGNMQDGDPVDDCPMYEVELDGISVTEIRTLVPITGGLAVEAAETDGMMVWKYPDGRVEMFGSVVLPNANGYVAQKTVTLPVPVLKSKPCTAIISRQPMSNTANALKSSVAISKREDVINGTITGVVPVLQCETAWFDQCSDAYRTVDIDIKGYWK